jgi:RimJ/RimL family protein N-acetyltransferase
MDLQREQFETERLLVRQLEADDLEALLPIYTSNPEYLSMTEGSAGEAGRYDLGMLERDFAIAGLVPGRRFAGVFLKPELEPVGVVDWLLENPSDGKPWIGLVLMRADRQRQGLGRETLAGLDRHLRQQGLSEVRAAVIERNAAGRALTESAGFELVETKVQRLAAGEETLLVFEHRLEP